MKKSVAKKNLKTKKRVMEKAAAQEPTRIPSRFATFEDYCNAVKVAKTREEKRKARLRLEAFKERETKPGWVPPRMADEIMHSAATNPKGGLSLSMDTLMLDDSKFIIVRTQRGGVTNRDEFKAELAKIGIRVIFLEYSPNNIAAPQVDFHTQVKR